MGGVKVFVVAALLALAPGCNSCGGKKGDAPAVDALSMPVPASVKDWRTNPELSRAVASLPSDQRDAVTAYLDMQAQQEKDGWPSAIPPGTKVGDLIGLAQAATAAAAVTPDVPPEATPGGNVVPMPTLPPGGSVKYGVIYDANGKAIGCEDGTQACLAALEAPAAPDELQAELCKNVDAIKKAQLQYDVAFGGFVPTKQAPRKVEQLDATAAAWTDGSAFDTLGWSPDGPVRGSYWVDIKGKDFVVHGVGKTADGKFVHCTADKVTDAASAPWP